MKQVEDDRLLHISAQKNRLALLGHDIPKVCQLIKANKNRFNKAPIGPIGMYIKLKDLKWANPVEFCIRKAMNNFICDSQQDRQALDRLCRENNVRPPDLITTKYFFVVYDAIMYFRFVDHKVNTAENEPLQEIHTVLRSIDVENPTVYNSLVDQFSLEDFMLIESDDEARHLMRRNVFPILFFCYFALNKQF